MNSRVTSNAAGLDLTPLDTGVDGLSCWTGGDGGRDARPLLYLHGLRSGQGDISECLSLLTARHRAICPTMPGFGSSPPLARIRTVDDAAYLYLEWLDSAGIEAPILMGSSIGSWLALEMVTKSPSSFDALVLVSPLGVRSGPPDLRFFPDVFSLSPAEVDRLLWADPERAEVDLAALSDADLAAHMRDREAIARYGWDPYLHTPGLVDRLGRVRVPTLMVRGEEDGLVSPQVVGLLGERIAESELVTVSGAGHHVDIEQPGRLADAVEAFLVDSGVRSAGSTA